MSNKNSSLEMIRLGLVLAVFAAASCTVLALVNSVTSVKIAANKIAKQLGIYESGFRLVLNSGKDAGQTVFHFHMHLIPRYKEDGQKIGWNPGSPSQEELEEIKNQILS